MKEIYLTWSVSDEEDSIFDESAKTIQVDEPLVKSNTLDLDVLFYVKKTSVTQIIDDIFNSVKMNNDTIKNVKDLVACIILCAIYPASSDYLKSPENQFRDIISKFKESRGEWVLEKTKINTDDEKEVIKLLERHKLLIESDDYYHVVGYILKNLKIDF